MTSQAVADTLVAAAKQLQVQSDLSAQPSESFFKARLSKIQISLTETATLGLLLGLAIIMRTRWQSHRRARAAWLLLTIGVLGVWTGNLISMSLLVGWAFGGIAWQIAPGLAVLVLVSLMLPPLFKSNVYCSHLCPHGAIQQLIRPQRNSRRYLRLSTATQQALKWLPAVTLVSASIALLLWPETDLASWEPFHAYLYPLAGAATIAIAVLSVVVSAVIPMAYCRFGCPTGSLLDYLRRSARSNHFHRGDAVLVSLLVMAAFR